MKTYNKTILASLIAVALSQSLFVPTSLAQSPGIAVQGSAAGQATQTDASQAKSKKHVTELKEVEVTARRVEELAQDVPLPVTVITAATIADKGFQSANDIARFTPGITIHEGWSRTALNAVVIRGQAGGAYFIDGIFVDGPIAGYDLSNVERVEVIRGPQSALFGRRTFSGAINFITKLPGDKPEGSVSLQVGNKGQQQGHASYSAPLGKTLSFRVNAYHDQTDGLFYNTVSGKDDLGGQKTTSFGGSLYWHPNSAFSATLRGNYLDDNDQPAGQFRYLNDRLNCFGKPTGQLYVNTYPIYTGRPNVCGRINAPSHYAIDTPAFIIGGYPAGAKFRTLRSDLAMDYSFENGWALSSVTAYSTQKTYNAMDQDFSAARGYGGAYETIDAGASHDFSQEFRLSSDQSLPLHGMVGVYMYDQGNGYGYTGDLTGIDLAPGQPGNFLGRATTTIVTPNATLKNRAIFGMLEYRFNDSWKASIELRRNEDKMGNIGTDTRMLTINGVPTLLSNTYNHKATFLNTLPRITLSYQMRDGLNFYALYAKGNKPGGLNVGVEDARLTAASRQSLIDSGYGIFEEETALTTELGMKSLWFDNRLRINAAIYSIIWHNQQGPSAGLEEWVNGQFITNSFTRNLGKSHVTGLELEGAFQLSSEWLMNFSYTYLDPRIVRDIDLDYANYIGSTDAKGKQIGGTAANTASLGATYQGTLANGWGVVGNADVSYEGSRYGDSTNINWTGSSTVVNFRVGIEPVKNLRITAYVNNAFNNESAEAIMKWTNQEHLIAYPNLVTGTGYMVNNPRSPIFVARPPRLFGVRLDYRF